MKNLFLALLAVYSFSNLYQPENTSIANYALDPEKSVVEWFGASPKVSHQGSFDVICKELEVADGQIKSGTFAIPIASIKNFDLPKALKPVLLKHLKSKDFFNVAIYPEATFRITQVSPIANALEGTSAGANALVTGDFSLLGNTQPISFPAKIDFHENNLEVEATFKLDRTKWGMNHAADPALKKHHIYPEVGIHLKIAAIKN